MTTFDFIQIEIPAKYIKNPNTSILGNNTDVGEPEKLSLKSNGRKIISDHNLKLIFDINSITATIGFSAKILGRRYPELINKNNIRECLYLLTSEYPICEEIDIENVLLEAKCNRLEVTQDLKLDLQKPDFQNINNLVVDTKKWKTLTGNNGFVKKNGFGVMRSKGESIILYGKGTEMNLKKNAAFVTENQLDGIFDGMTRVEAKLNNRKAIRDRFGTDDLIGILQSDRNPQVDILKEVFKDANINVKSGDGFIKSQRDRERLSYAREFKSDFGAITKDLKQRLKRNWRREHEHIMRVAHNSDPNVSAYLKTIDNIKSLLLSRNN
jgi:hypothetical protein